MRFDSKTKVTLAIAVLGLLQAATAGFLHWQRTVKQEQLATSKAQIDFAMRQLQHELTRPAQPGAETAPRATLEQPKLLPNPDVAGTLRMVHSLAESASLEFGTVKALQSNTTGKQTYQITGVGTPSRVCHFLANLEHGERLVVVESGRVTPNSAVDLAFEFVLATYHEGDR